MGLTPREKAIDTYNFFRNKMPVLAANGKAKKEGLLFIDRQLKTLEVGKEFRDTTEDVEYWQEARNELVNLK